MAIEMGSVPGSRAVPAGDPAAWGRSVRLGRAAFGRIARASKGLYLAGGISMGAGIAAHTAGAPVLLADVIGMGTAVTLTAPAPRSHRHPRSPA